MELVIFDCDGVLIDSEIVADRVVLDYCRGQFPEIDFSHWSQQMTGIQISDILKLMEDHHTIRFPADADEAILQSLNRVLVEEVEAIDGVADALAQIGQPKAVASNSHSIYVRQLLTSTQLIHHFGDSIFGADLVEHPKPRPDLYLLAASTLSVKPQHCIVIEDSVPGVTAASSAGMNVIGFTGGSHSGAENNAKLRAAGASEVMDSMTQLAPMLTGIASGKIFK